VHAVWQAKKDGKWSDVPSNWEQERHYFLFSWLAGVRNGYGFAGVKTYAPVKPIAERRGLPDDFEIDGDEHPTVLEAIDPRRAKWIEDEEKANPKAWMGDHSHSWLTADEILSAPRPEKVWRTGVTSIEIFNEWDGCSRPKEVSGGIAGPSIRVATSPVDVTEDSTHVQVYWLELEPTLDYFVDEVKRLKTEHGEVRIVFGFDS
jgi:hypothetical protein